MSNERQSSQNESENNVAEDVVEQTTSNSEEQAGSEDVEQLKKQLSAAEKKAEEHWDKAVRATAEMENLRRRTQKDIENAHKYALEKFAKELLTVLDSLELGIQAASSDHPEVVKLREGSELTKKQLESVFSKFNIEVIDPLGQPFNPELHQAMSTQPSSDVEPNTVINVFQKGYLLNGRLIRPAMVVVSKAEDNPQGDSVKIDEQA